MQRDDGLSFGPLRLQKGYFPKHVIGLALAGIGFDVMYSAYGQLSQVAPSSFATGLSFGSFVALNGLYLFGFRFRTWPVPDEPEGDGEDAR